MECRFCAEQIVKDAIEIGAGSYHEVCAALDQPPWHLQGLPKTIAARLLHHDVRLVWRHPIESRIVLEAEGIYLMYYGELAVEGTLAEIVAHVPDADLEAVGDALVRFEDARPAPLVRPRKDAVARRAVCRACTAAITRPLTLFAHDSIVEVDAGDMAHIASTASDFPYVPPGSEVYVIDNSELIGPPAGGGHGCCGTAPYGSDAPNQPCTCGAMLGWWNDDCLAPEFVALDASAVELFEY